MDAAMRKSDPSHEGGGSPGGASLGCDAGQLSFQRAEGREEAVWVEGERGGETEREGGGGDARAEIQLLTLTTGV